MFKKGSTIWGILTAVLLTVLVVFCGTAYATSHEAPPAAEDTGGIKWDPALAGDLVYLMKGDVGFHPGAGLDLVSVEDDLLKIRLEAVWTEDLDLKMPDVLALAGGVNFIKAAQALGKALNAEVKISETFQKLAPSGGLLGGYNFSSEQPTLRDKLVWGWWISVVQLEFDKLPFIE
jgi:hypothetical protein